MTPCTKGIKMRILFLLSILCFSHIANAQIYESNYVKINPYLIARGAFTIGYERSLHPYHSVEINGGVTYRDFIHELVNLDTDNFGDSRSTVKLGHIVDLAYKFYPKTNDYFEGPYLSPGVLFKKYNIQHEVSYSSTYNTKMVDAGYSMKEIYLKFGYVYESWIYDDLIVDAYLGFGIRNIRKEDYEIINSTMTRNEEVITFITESRVPAVYLGLKIGFIF